MEADRREQQMRRRREEQRRIARRRNRTRREKTGQRRKWILLIMLCLLLMGGLLTAAFTFLFPVKNVQVEGNAQYTVQEIKAASGIQEGNNLLRLSPDSVEAAVRQACPYIRHVYLQRKLPNRVIITVEEAGAALALRQAQGYVLTTDEYEYIETTEQPFEGIAVYGVTVTPDRVGQPVAFADGQQQEQLEGLLKELNAQSITQITKIDLTDPTQIRLQYSAQHIWKLGDLSNLAYKLRFGAEISRKEADTGTVDLSGLTTGKSGYFKSEVLGEFVPAVTATDAVSAGSEESP